MWFWLFCLSIFVNLFLLFYVRWLFLRIAETNEQVLQTSTMITEFLAHVSQIHETEMFYGDKTLQGLISHSQDLVEALNQVDFIVGEIEEPEVEN